MVGIGECQGRNRERIFSAKVQGLTAGDQYLEGGTRCEEIDEQRRCGHHLLKVVQDQKQLLLLQERFHKVYQGNVQLFFQAKSHADGGHHELWVTDRCKSDEIDSISEMLADL